MKFTSWLHRSSLGRHLNPFPPLSPCCSNKICENSFCETFVATEKNNFRSKMFFYLAGHKHNRTRIVSKWAERGDGGGGGCDLHPGNAIFVVCELWNRIWGARLMIGFLGQEDKSCDEGADFTISTYICAHFLGYFVDSSFDKLLENFRPSTAAKFRLILLKLFVVTIYFIYKIIFFFCGNSFVSYTVKNEKLIDTQIHANFFIINTFMFCFFFLQSENSNSMKNSMKIPRNFPPTFRLHFGERFSDGFTSIFHGTLSTLMIEQFPSCNLTHNLIHHQCLALFCAISQTKTKRKNHKICSLDFSLFALSIALLSRLLHNKVSSRKRKVGIFEFSFFRRKKDYYINFSRLKLHWKFCSRQGIFGTTRRIQSQSTPRLFRLFSVLFTIREVFGQSTKKVVKKAKKKI